MTQRYAVIMAGGAGKRLWPLSRPRRPKQLLRLFGGQSLLRLSFERLRHLLPADRICLVAAEDDLPLMRAELPEIPIDNFFVEPCARDTANAIGLAAHLLARRDPGVTMGVFTADHLIEPVGPFADTVLRGYEAAERHAPALVTFGIRPRGPHTGYGYLRRGEPLAEGLYRVREMREKPDEATARQFLDSGEYFWNSGMFVWTLPAILAELERCRPEHAAALRAVAAECADPAGRERVRRAFAALPRISIDHAVLERAGRMLVLELPCDWHDVGAWTSLAEVLPPDAAGNISAGVRTAALGASGNIVVGEEPRLVALIGVHDLVVVHAPEATLICRREDAQRVKELLDQLPPDPAAG